jgi:small subunit ribosomal protein S14
MIKDYKKRMTVKKYAVDRIRLNTLRKNDILPIELRDIASHELHNNFPRDSAMNRIVNRCMITSRPRGNVVRFRCSRIMFRHFADYNKLAGIQRAMW